MQYYVYRHIRLDTNQPFYIGIGKKPSVSKIKGWNTEYSRAYEKVKRNKFWKNVVNKTDYKVEILLETNNNHLLKELEKYFISIYGRACCDPLGLLTNFTSGGELNDGPKQRGIRIVQLDKEQKIIKIWNELKDIQTELGFLKTNIVKCCRKKAVSAYGFYWRYADDTSYDTVYPSAARKKQGNNRNGIIITHKVNKEQKLFRTAQSVAEYLNCDRTTVARYLKKGQSKEYYFQYQSWNKL